MITAICVSSSPRRIFHEESEPPMPLSVRNNQRRARTKNDRKRWKREKFESRSLVASCARRKTRASYIPTTHHFFKTHSDETHQDEDGAGSQLYLVRLDPKSGVHHK
jgi:hypothetical protein